MSRRVARALAAIALLIAGLGAAVTSAAPGGGNGGSPGGHDTTTSTTTSSTTTSSSSTTTTSTTVTIPPSPPGSQSPGQNLCVAWMHCELWSHGGTVAWSSQNDRLAYFSITVWRGSIRVMSSSAHVGRFEGTLSGDLVDARIFDCNTLFDHLSWGGCDHWSTPSVGGYVLVVNPVNTASASRPGREEAAGEPATSSISRRDGR